MFGLKMRQIKYCRCLLLYCVVNINTFFSILYFLCVIVFRLLVLDKPLLYRQTLIWPRFHLPRQIRCLRLTTVTPEKQFKIQVCFDKIFCVYEYTFFPSSFDPFCVHSFQYYSDLSYPSHQSYNVRYPAFKFLFPTVNFTLPYRLLGLLF